MKKNGELISEYFSYGFGQKVWWKCDNGHEWKAIISNRVKGRGCPECAKERRHKK